MANIRAAIMGRGNIGKAVLEAIEASPDMECAGVILREGAKKDVAEFANLPQVTDVKELGKVDVVILCTPSRRAPECAKLFSDMGICTVDSFDIHTQIWDVKKELDEVCKKNGTASIISAGWDPGSDSMVRALMEAMAPKGITYTNFGPGMSMGHTVAVKAIDGVENALSMTIPTGTGIHRRMVYVQLKPGADFATVENAVKTDPYFVHDETHVEQVDDVMQLLDTGHGVNLVRKGVSGATHNQLFEFDMKINNPALTAQILIASARAVLKQQPGCYTMIEIAPIDYLYGEKEALIKKLV
jgi:diaminopimelate dehydrogenase